MLLKIKILSRDKIIKNEKNSDAGKYSLVKSKKRKRSIPGVKKAVIGKNESMNARKVIRIILFLRLFKNFVLILIKNMQRYINPKNIARLIIVGVEIHIKVKIFSEVIAKLKTEDRKYCNRIHTKMSIINSLYNGLIFFHFSLIF